MLLEWLGKNNLLSRADLDKVGVAGTVDVGVVALRSRVLQVGRVDGDAAGSLLRCVVDGGIVLKKTRLPLNQASSQLPVRLLNSFCSKILGPSSISTYFSNSQFGCLT